MVNSENLPPSEELSGPSPSFQRFGLAHGSEAGIGREELNLDEVIESLRNYLQELRGGERTQAEFGQAVGKVLIEALDGLNLSRLKGSERRRVVSTVRMLHGLLERVYNGDYLIRRNGILAEYGVASALSHRLGYSVYYPSGQEDTSYGIDWWVGLDGGRLLAIQVKCIETLAGKPYFRVVRQDNDLNEIVRACPNGIHDEDRFLRSGVSMLEYAGMYDNVTAAYVIVTPLGSEGSQLSSLTGEPSEGFVGALSKFLEKEFSEREVQVA